MSRFAMYKEELGISVIDDMGVYASGERLKQYIPSMEDQDIDKFVIIKSKLLYIAADEIESKAAQSLGLGGGSGDSSDSGAAIKEIQSIISGVIEVKEDLKEKVPTDDSQLLDEPEHTNNADGLIGTRLFSRSGLNLTNKTWNILIEYDRNNEEVERYESGYYWLKKGVTYTIDGEPIEFKNDYVVDYSKNEYTVLSGRAVNWNENSTLAVTEGLVLNVDPMSLADGEWINNSTGKTYEEEIVIANSIEDEEEKIKELNKIRKENFYNFYVINSVTNAKTDTGIQKIGDAEYDIESKSLKLNKDETNNASGEGGYLKLMRNGVDFSEGFTFELYFSTDRFGYAGEKGGDALYEGFFSRTSSLTTSDFTSALRCGFVEEDALSKSSLWIKLFGSSSYTGRNENCFVEHGGSLYIRDHGGIVLQTPSYITFVYSHYNENKSDEYKQLHYDQFMIDNQVDKIEYYINGNLYTSMYYGNDSYEAGLRVWNNDSCPFFIGVATIGNYKNNSFLKGNIYTTRLYTQSMTATQVKDNYDMTLKYRSSF